MLVRQRFPNYVAVGGDIPIHEINSLKELYALDFVQRWMRYPEFVELRYSNNGPDSELLMVIETEKWWVIAYGREGSFTDLGLKEWKSPNE